MRLFASPMVKLLAPFAGAGAFALVVATAWLLLPEAAAAPLSRGIVAAELPGAPGEGGAAGVAVEGAGPAGRVPCVVCARVIPPVSKLAAAMPSTRDFM